MDIQFCHHDGSFKNHFNAVKPESFNFLIFFFNIFIIFPSFRGLFHPLLCALFFFSLPFRLELWQWISFISQVNRSLSLPTSIINWKFMMRTDDLKNMNLSIYGIPLFAFLTFSAFSAKKKSNINFLSTIFNDRGVM